jgi:hypothetical protein
MAWIEIERRVDAERDSETVRLQNFVEVRTPRLAPALLTVQSRASAGLRVMQP